MAEGYDPFWNVLPSPGAEPKVPDGSESVTTDCRTPEGVAVGLIDGVIAIARVLRQADLGSEAVHEALADLRADEDVLALLAADR